jgi:hypothetical protein
MIYSVVLLSLVYHRLGFLDALSYSHFGSGRGCLHDMSVATDWSIHNLQLDAFFALRPPPARDAGTTVPAVAQGKHDWP